MRDAYPHCHHHADLFTCIEHIRWKILEVCINDCWVYSVESVFKMQLVLPVTFIIFAIYGIARVKLAHSILGDREHIFENSSCYPAPNRKYQRFPLCWLYHHMLSVSYISRESWFCFLYYFAVLWCTQIIQYIMARWSYPSHIQLSVPNGGGWFRKNEVYF